MNRNFGVGILILCFGLSSVNIALAGQITQAQPVIVQPNDLRDINQQMLEQDRINRDQELAIRGLIDDNQKLTNTALSRKQDATLEKINQTMIKYRDSLLSRDRARIETNSQKISKYYDLIKLTEDVDDSKSVGQTLALKRDVIEGKYKILEDLKKELMVLNEKLKNEPVHVNLGKTDNQQEDKIQTLTQKLGEMDKRIARYDEILAEKDKQIAQLKTNLDRVQGEAAGKDAMIKEKNEQVNLLKSELEDKISHEKNQGPKDELIKQQENQIAVFKAQLRELYSREENIRSQADQIAKVSEHFKSQSAAYADVQAQVTILRNKIQQQDIDLKTKNESIRWLNQVVSAAKNKAEYYQLTSQNDQMTVAQVQKEVLNIKDGFAQHFKDYDQFEKAIVALKSQVSQLGVQLSQKQSQADLLKSELDNKIAQEKNQEQQQARIVQDLKDQLQDKGIQIARMKTDLLEILQDRANKEIYLHNTSVQLDDRVKLAKQLIDLQQQESALLEEKSNLAQAQNDIFEQHALALEGKIKGLLVNHKILTVDLQNRLEELKNKLSQKQEQADLFETQLKEKITEEKNQSVLANQIQDLKVQLQDKEDQIAAMKQEILAGQKTKAEVDNLKQQLALAQDKAEQLKQELDSKTAQSEQMTLMIKEYQKKLESRNSALNEELKQKLSAKNDQANDLSVSIVQQKLMDEKIKEIRKLGNALALAHKQLDGMPSNDEIVFLRTGLQKATLELKQKDEMLAQIKANAAEYEKEFKAQTKEFQSLKDQLQDAQDVISRKNEDLKYKNLEITGLKDRFKMSGKILPKTLSNTHENKTEALQAQLMSANAQVKELRSQLDQFISPSKKDPVREKLKQALDKIDEQGRLINALVQKLQDFGQNVNLTKMISKK